MVSCPCCGRRKVPKQKSTGLRKCPRCGYLPGVRQLDRGGYPMRPLPPNSNGHVWANKFGLVLCEHCLIVRRADDQNAQCKGPAPVGPRAVTQPTLLRVSTEMRAKLKEFAAQAKQADERMKLMIALPGFEPTYSVEQSLSDNTFNITVTPPSMTGLLPSSIVLNAEQYERFLKWRAGGHGMIQDLFPDLDDNQREILNTGIAQADWDRMFKDEE